MLSKRIVVIGTSAGGIETLRLLVAQLPSSFPAPICVVMHTAPQSPGVLAEILQRSGRLRASIAHTGDRLVGGHIYTAPADCHLLVEPGRVLTTRGPRENRFRPAVDPLFRSAAQVFGPNAIGVLLTGNLDDGTAGLWAIKRLGGIAVVQEPSDALFPGMPQHAIRHVEVDHIVPLAQMGALLTRLVDEPVEPVIPAGVPETVNVEVSIAKERNSMEAGLERVAGPSRYACPECHGVLLQIKEADRIRFRCHTGHAYSADSLVAAVSEGIEASLWEGVRALEEGALLMHELAQHTATHANGAAAAQGFETRAAESHRQAKVIRELLQVREPLTVESKV